MKRFFELVSRTTWDNKDVVRVLTCAFGYIKRKRAAIFRQHRLFRAKITLPLVVWVVMCSSGVDVF